MRNPVVLFLLGGLILAGPLAAQPAVSRPHPDVPATLDVAGLHLVLSEEAQRLVQQKADGLCRHQPSFQARVDLADAAFPIIDRVLKEEGLPLDFRYLPLQESALIGDARSEHEAVGYWQLKRETATELGLVVNNDVDERQHLTASTRAAARYLTRNNASLHNWLNALLSYNTGLSGVKPYTLPTDADATEIAITEATSPYVLMFLAQKIAFEPACGQNPAPALRLREFAAMAGQSLETQAHTLHADPAALAVHNRWLLAAAVPADRTYTLIVPVSGAAQAAGLTANQRLQSRPELVNLPPVSATNADEVQLNDLQALIALPGETTADLALRGGKRLGDFLRDNELGAFDLAIAGRPYYLESKRDAAAVEYHVVQPGETVFDVAQKYGIRKKNILAKNHLDPADELRPGRVLWLQHVRPREVAIEYRTLREGLGLERPVVNRRPPMVEGPTSDRPAETPPIPADPAPAEVVQVRPAAAPRRAAVVNKDGWGEALPAPAAAPAPAPLADEPRPARAPVAARPPADPAPTPALPAQPAAASNAPVAIATPETEATHRVEPHESVYSISRRYQTSPATLMALNHLAPPAGLVVGQVLLLKAPLAAPGAAPPAGQNNPVRYAPKVGMHTVAGGETLYSIARRYGVSVTDLQTWNSKADTSVQLGEILRLQVGK